MTQHSSKLNIFFAYSRNDEFLRNRLDIHLSGLKRQDFVKTWFDGKIDAGMEWQKEITLALSNANIILLLISADFLASDYCYDIEMKKAIERHEKGEAVTIPIIVSHCDWIDSPFSKLQALPKDGVPLLDAKWHSVEEALHSVAIGIKQVSQKMLNKTIDQIPMIDDEPLKLSRQVDQKSLVVSTKDVDPVKKYKENYIRFEKMFYTIIDKAVSKEFKIYKDFRLDGIESCLLLNSPLLIDTDFVLKIKYSDSRVGQTYLYSCINALKQSVNYYKEKYEAKSQGRLVFLLSQRALYEKQYHTHSHGKTIDLLDYENKNLRNQNIYISYFEIEKLETYSQMEIIERLKL